MTGAALLLPLASVWLAFGTLLVLGTVARARRQARAIWPQPRDLPGPVLMVRPCAGREPGLEANLMSVLNMQPTKCLSVLHVVPYNDPAVPTVQRACLHLRRAGWQAHCLVSQPHGANHKVAQLAQSEELWAAYQAVVCVDSDVQLDNFCLRQLLAPLGDPRCGAVWAPFVPADPCHTWGDRALQAVLGGSLHGFRLLGALDRHGMVGKVLALRPAALRAVGGWQALTAFLGEDMELGRRLRRAGYKIHVANGFTHTWPPQRNLRSAWERMVRWLMVIRSQRTRLLWSYPLVFFPTAPLCLLAGAGAWLGPQPTATLWGAGLILMACAVRLSLGWACRRLYGWRPSWRMLIVDALLADALLACAWLRALGSRRLRWRQRFLRLDRRGHMHEISRA